MDERFAIVLVVVLIAGALMSLGQHRTYSRATRRLAQAHEGQHGSFLVSGRGKGWFRGAVVLLVVNGETASIDAAEAMIGASVFARFRPRPELLGPLAGAVERTDDKHLRLAVAQAAEQYRTISRKRGSASAKR